MAEVKEVKVPDIGDFEDVPVIELLVGPGDSVQNEDPLVVLESDKATMEVPSPLAGTVKEMMVSAGDRVSQGTLLLTLEVGGGDADEPADDEGEETEREGGTPEQASDAGKEAASEAEAEAPEVESEVSGDESGEERQPPSPAAAHAEESPAESAEQTIYASPSVRRLARERGIDLSRVKGTGRKGRITREDVERGEEAAPAGAPAQQRDAAAGDLGLAPWPKVDFEKFGEIERVPLTRIQRISGPNLARNWVRIPHVTHDDDADITDLEAFRKQVNSEQDVKVTMVALLLKAVIASLKAYPQLNASLDGDELVLKRHYHLGFAADTPQGLLVPVIRDVDSKGLLAIAAELRELSGKAREGKLGLGDMQGGTFTISSLGGIGGTGFTPIVNAPEVAILGVTRSQMKPVWDGSQFVPRLMVPLSLSYDHRVIDGALAARFMAHLVQVLGDLKRVLL